LLSGLLCELCPHPGDEADEPCEGEGEEEEDQREEGDGEDGGEGRQGDPQPLKHQHPELVNQVDAEGAASELRYGPAPGPLLADPQHIAEEDAEGGRCQHHIGGKVPPPELLTSADEPGPHEGEGQPQDPQNVEDVLSDPADLEVPEIPASHIAPHPARHQMDLEPV